MLFLLSKRDEFENRFFVILKCKFVDISSYLDIFLSNRRFKYEYFY